MKRKRMTGKLILIVFLLFCLLSTDLVYAFDLKDYPSSTISDVLKMARDYYNAQLKTGSAYSDNFIAFNMRGHPFSAGALNLEKARPLSEPVKKLLDMDGKLHSRDMLATYTQEINPCQRL